MENLYFTVNSGWEIKRIKDLLPKYLNGVWGEYSNNDSGIPVLRSTEQNVEGKLKIVDPAILDIKKVGSELDEILGLAAQRQNEINYGLKATQILSSDRAKQVFEKGEKFDWDLNKILSELQIPKPQKELIKSFNTEDREKIIANLLANYSYTVEINTAYGETRINQLEDESIIEYQGWGYESFDGVHFEKFNLNFSGTAERLEIPEEEYNKIKELAQKSPTQHYSNLTVPGGTNYTEQEISTPLITPSIKGHAQFSTDNGIGWFRSDDKIEFLDKEDLIRKGIIKQVPCG